MRLVVFTDVNVAASWLEGIIRAIPGIDGVVECRVDADERQARDALLAFAPDVGVSLAVPYPPPALSRIPTVGTLQVHFGALPDFGIPVGFWELLRETTTVGACLQWIDERGRGGTIEAADEAPIFDRDSLADVQARATELAALVLRTWLQQAARGALRRPANASGISPTVMMPSKAQRARLGARLWWRRVQRAAQPRRLVKHSVLGVALYLYRPLRDLWRTIRGSHPVRLFTFHRVTAVTRDGMTVSPETFDEQIEYIARHHEVVGLEEAVAIIRTGVRLRRPVAALTFDDAYRSVFDTAWPMLARRGMTACCFASTDLVASDRRFTHDEGDPMRHHFAVMDWRELKELRAAGWSIAPHGASHLRLSECGGEVLRRELEEPRRVLRDQLGVPADILAYPFGQPNDISREALDLAVRAGYTTILADHSGETATGNQARELGRFDIGGDHARWAWKCAAHGIELSRWRRGRTAPAHSEKMYS